MKDSILSHVEDMNGALVCCNKNGPTFNYDLVLGARNSDLKEYDYCYCKQSRYQKKIRDTEHKFLIEDYEVFRILKRNG